MNIKYNLHTIILPISTDLLAWILRVVRLVSFSRFSILLQQANSQPYFSVLTIPINEDFFDSAIKRVGGG